VQLHVGGLGVGLTFCLFFGILVGGRWGIDRVLFWFVWRVAVLCGCSVMTPDYLSGFFER
jgi:hypothetical protein